MRPRSSPAGVPCAGLAEHRSALVDGALEADRREQLLTHLVHCTPCRLDVVELRRLRDRLRTPAAAEAPHELAQRLVSIAGAEATRPLWTRPFRRTRPGSLPSRRRALRVRRTALTFAVGATVAGAGVVGYLAAPTSSVAAVSDPGSEARAEFNAVLAQFPLANDALGAVMSARPSDLAAPVPVSDAFTATLGGRPLTADQGRAAMERAAGAAETVSYRGLQNVRIEGRGGPVSATVEVVAQAGQGTRSRVLGAAGEQTGSGFAPAASATRIVDQKLVALLERNYTLTAWAGAQAAGRPATLVQAAQSGQVAARWWVDDASGVVLAQQSFDSQGEPVVQVGFTSVQITRSGAMLEHLPAALSVPTTDVVLTLDAATELDQRGWVCRDTLGSLSLVRLRSSSSTEPAAVHLVYSDGLSTVSVFEQRGRLDVAPSGTTWDAALGAYVQDGASSLASWQSGDTVFTVVTDGSTELLAAAVSALPHEPEPQPTTMENIRAGWASILADLKG